MPMFWQFSAGATALFMATPQGREMTADALEGTADALDDLFDAPSQSSTQSNSQSNTQPLAVPTSPSQTVTCTSAPDPSCVALLAKISSRMTELEKRLSDMETDKLGLFQIRPRAIPGKGSWPGHIDQFKGKQQNLRKMLDNATTLCCPIPRGAWHLATRNPPNRPHLR